jgi:hypothetical protein
MQCTYQCTLHALQLRASSAWQLMRQLTSIALLPPLIDEAHSLVSWTFLDLCSLYVHSLNKSCGNSMHSSMPHILSRI